LKERKTPGHKPIGANATEILGISARIAAIGPHQITNPVKKNLNQASSATSAKQNARTESAKAQ